MQVGRSCSESIALRRLDHAQKWNSVRSFAREQEKREWVDRVRFKGHGRAHAEPSEVVRD
jgi:hypothetical protein